MGKVAGQHEIDHDEGSAQHPAPEEVADVPVQDFEDFEDDELEQEEGEGKR